MALKSVRIVDFCGKSSGFTEFKNTVDRGLAVTFWRGFRIMPDLMFGSWVLNKIWIMDLSSALISMLITPMDPSKFFLRSKLRCETVIGVVLCYSHQACCRLFHLFEINNGIHIYQSTFELLHFYFRMWLWFRI